MLDDRIYNARGWKHAGLDRVGEGRGGRGEGGADRRGAADEMIEPVTSIWHWHGYKPDDVQCWLDAMRSGKWPQRAWRDLEGCDGRGRCRYRPVKDSGCRWFSRLELAPCYLRTYVHLLLQHQRFLWLARHNLTAAPH